MIDLNLSTDIITDSNHYMRRFFRCWIDGSYNGEAHYLSNCHHAREHYETYSKLRSRVISEWCQYLAAENDCAPATVQNHMVSHFTGDQLAELTAELVDDFRDLVRDEMEDEA